MNTTNRSAVVLGAALIFLTPLVAAADRGGTCKGREHFKQKMEERFTAADSDGDGRLSLAEFKSAREARMENRFQRFDQNEDGYVDREEMKKMAKKHHRKWKKRHGGVESNEDE